MAGMTIAHRPVPAAFAVLTGRCLRRPLNPTEATKATKAG